MTRDISASVLGSLDDEVIYPFFAIELNFDGNEVLRLWTGVGTLNYDGLEWYGTASILSVDAIEETSELAAKGATITLSSVPSEILSLALSEPYQGRTATIYFGLFSKGSLQQESGDYILLENGSKILLETQETGLTEIFSGYMDQMPIEEGPDSSTISLSIENKLIELERPRVARYTSGYQKSLYSGDLGFDFVEDLQDKEIFWGKKVS